MDINEVELLDGIVEHVRECGNIMVNATRTMGMVSAKEGHANFVTIYDRKVQEELRDRLLSLAPEAAFAGEEDDGGFYIPLEGLVFVVDPIDGTTNFIWDFHASCISVGVLSDGKQLLGVIYNPYLNEMYTAIKGKGAYLNGRRIQVFEGDVSSSLTVFGTAPYYEELRKSSFDYAYNMLGKCADVRRGGSAAIDLCTVASGRASIYFELRLSPWDFAAGSLIVTEAGGIVTDVDGNELDITKKCSMIARGKGCEDVVRDIFGWEE